MADAKTKYWVGVLYPENMIEGWEIKIGDLLELPYAYCLHSSDTDVQSEHRKDHIHLMVAWPNTTTYKHALSVFARLNAPGKKACNAIKQVINVRHMYNYLIHDTDACRASGKHLYLPEERITGNNFDIGSFEQLSIEEKREIYVELVDKIIEQGIYNFIDLHNYIKSCGDRQLQYYEIVTSYGGAIRLALDGMYQKIMIGKECSREGKG